MPTHTKKTAHAHTHPKHVPEASKISKSVIAMIEPAKKAQEKAIEKGRENADALIQAGSDIQDAAAQYREVSSGHVDALVRSGEVASHISQNMSHEMMESGNRLFLEMAEISQEAFACKTLQGALKLQHKMMQIMADSYLDTANTLCGLMFDSCDKALDALGERTAAASRQRRKALAG